MSKKSVFPFLVALLWLQGCAATPVLSAMPETLLKAVIHQFGGKEVSVPYSARSTLAAIQISLRKMQLDADILELNESGYYIMFENNNLHGKIQLERVTPKLTTLQVRVHSNMREEPVEKAIVETVQYELRHLPANRSFRFAGYHNLRSKPSVRSSRLGWYRTTAKLSLHEEGKTGWFRLKLPSGRTAYLKKSRAVKVASR